MTLLRGSPWNFVMMDKLEKPSIIDNWGRGKTFYDNFSHFDTIHKCYGHQAMVSTMLTQHSMVKSNMILDITG